MNRSSDISTLADTTAEEIGLFWLPNKLQDIYSDENEAKKI